VPHKYPPVAKKEAPKKEADAAADSAADKEGAKGDAVPPPGVSPAHSFWCKMRLCQYLCCHWLFLRHTVAELCSTCDLPQIRACR